MDKHKSNLSNFIPPCNNMPGASIIGEATQFKLAQGGLGRAASPLIACVWT